MRIGLFGGSFDPVHLGHLWTAESALEQLSLDEVRWIPAAQSPLKASPPIASDEQRLMMIRLAIGGTPRHVVDTRELSRKEISYTVRTVEEICEKNPDNEYFFIAGSDSLASMPDWYMPEKILGLVTLCVVNRGGNLPPDYSVLNGIVDPQSINRIKESEIKMPAIEVSSSAIRDRIKRGRSVRYQVPHAVTAYLDAEKIYC